MALDYGRVRYIIADAPAHTDGVGADCPDAVPIVYRDRAVLVQRIEPKFKD